jgi:hypothetical protein
LRVQLSLRRILTWLTLFSLLSAFLSWLKFDFRAFISASVSLLVIAVLQLFHRKVHTLLRVSYYSIAIAISIAFALATDYGVLRVARSSTTRYSWRIAMNDAGEIFVKVAWSCATIAMCAIISILFAAWHFVARKKSVG